MRLTIRLLGAEILHISTDPDDAYNDEGDALNGGTSAAYPIGFAPQPGDQRWDKGSEYYPPGWE